MDTSYRNNSKSCSSGDGALAEKSLRKTSLFHNESLFGHCPRKDPVHNKQKKTTKQNFVFMFAILHQSNKQDIAQQEKTIAYGFGCGGDVGFTVASGLGTFLDFLSTLAVYIKSLEPLRLGEKSSLKT